MRLALAQCRDAVASASTKMFSTAKGDDLSFEAGLVTVKTNQGKTYLIPASNVVYMEPADSKKK